MSTMQQSIEPSSSTLSDWLADAVALVQRVNARLKSGSPSVAAATPMQRQGRQVLTDNRCLELAALVDSASI